MTLILSGTDGLSDVDGSAATPAIRGTDTNTGIYFPAADTIAFSEGGVESMRLDSSGNVGIGTSSPINLLTVQTAATGTTAGSNVIARLQSNASGRDATLQLSDNVANSSTISMLSGATVFRQNGTESARITSGGDLLVGTTTARTGNNSLTFEPTNSYFQMRATGTGSLTQIAFIRNTAVTPAQVGEISTTGTATTYTTSSDYRLKENVAPMTGALEKVAALKPCTYKWKLDGSDGEGFIAHELAEVVPQAVTGEKDAVDADGSPVYQGIDTSFLVATLTAAIQEQQAIIQSLTARIEALEGK